MRIINYIQPEIISHIPNNYISFDVFILIIVFEKKQKKRI